MIVQPIIFLDVDGVLNSQLHYESEQFNKGFTEIAQITMANYIEDKELIKQLKLKVVKKCYEIKTLVT